MNIRFLCLIQALILIVATASGALAQGYQPPGGGGGPPDVSSATGLLAPAHGGTGLVAPTAPGVVQAFTNYALTGFGSGNWIDVTNSASLQALTGDMTIEFDFYPGAANSEVLFKADTNYNNAVFDLEYDHVYRGFTLYQGTSDLLCISTVTQIPLGAWIHVAITRTGNVYRTYLNGVLDNTNTNAVTVPTQTADMLIGNDSTNGFAGNFGNVAELRIWNLARTQPQIAANLGGYINPTTAGLVAYYRCAEGTGTTVADSTANANNGTITGGITFENTSLPFNESGYQVSLGIIGNLNSTGANTIFPNAAVTGLDIRGEVTDAHPALSVHRGSDNFQALYVMGGAVRVPYQLIINENFIGGGIILTGADSSILNQGTISQNGSGAAFTPSSAGLNDVGSVALPFGTMFTNALAVTSGANMLTGTYTIGGGGTVTINTTAVDANSYVVFAPNNALGATAWENVAARVNGTSFEIDGTSTGAGSWFIIKKN